MNVRLIKAGMRASDEKLAQPPVEVPIIVDTVRSWVREFQSARADRARLDFERIGNPRKI
jgi:hypothetical protein